MMIQFNTKKYKIYKYCLYWWFVNKFKFYSDKSRFIINKPCIIKSSNVLQKRDLLIVRKVVIDFEAAHLPNLGSVQPMR